MILISQRLHRRGFTVPEMLAVVAVLAIIISILLPTLSNAKEHARFVICKSQQRQIGLGLLAFAAEHRTNLPGCYAPPYSGPEEEKRSWLGSEAWGGVAYEGAVVRYVGGAEVARKLYRCPSLHQGTLGAGDGSNGFFDYTGLLVFTGARKSAVPGNSEWVDPTTGVRRTAPTPLIVEEDYRHYVNTCCIDPGHSNIDRTGVWHFGGGNYIAFDGHSEYLRPDGGLGPTTWDWYAKAPSGTIVQLSSHASGFGGWNSR